MTTEPLSPAVALDQGLDTVTHDRNLKGPRRLEVRQLWGGNLIDVRTFAAEEEVTVGSESGLRWSVLGRPMGWVHARWTGALQASPPFASSVGMTWRSDFVTEDETIEHGTSLTCVAVEQGRHLLRLDPAWPARVDLAGDRVEVAALVASGRAYRQDGRVHIPLDDELVVAFQVGAITLVALRSAVSARIRTATPGDPAVLVAGMAIAAMSALTALGVSYAPANMSDTIVGGDGPPMTMVFTPPPPKPIVTPAKPSEGEGHAAPKGPAGRIGDRDAKQRDARGGGKSITDSGLLAAWNDAASAIGMGLSTNLTTGIGGLIGSVGTQFGSTGMANRGGGLGGGGTADELGGIDTHGHGPGPGEGSDLGHKRAGAVSPHAQDLTLLGDGLSRALIDEVIKRKLPQIRYCYQKELQHAPELAGSLAIAFTIAGDGSVSRAGVKRDGLGSAAVAECVIEKFHQMQFPHPSGGGVVMVSYPFTFASN